jgi:DNA-binding NarL/FixJ family response regulator
VRGAIRNFFETRTPYISVIKLKMALSAIQTAEENHCELVVLDLAMPNLNDVETASILRQVASGEVCQLLGARKRR